MDNTPPSGKELRKSRALTGGVTGSYAQVQAEGRCQDFYPAPLAGTALRDVVKGGLGVSFG